MALITNFAELYPFAHNELPGCPQPLFTQNILQSARKFCEKSRIWIVDLDSIDLVDEQKTYTLTSLVGGVTYAARIDHIEAVRSNTEDGIAAGNVGALMNWRDYTYSPISGVLELETAPSLDITDGLEVKAVLVPHLSATDLPDWLLNRYAEVILAGAIYQLTSLPGKMWSSPESAAINRREFRNGIGRAKGDIARDYKDGSRGIAP